MKPLAIVVSDLHFRTDLRVLSTYPQPAGDVLVSMQQVTAYRDKLQQEVGYELPVIIAGDALDSKQCYPSAIAGLQEAFKGVQPIYFIQGQHDMYDPPWLNLLLPGSKHINKQRIQIGPFDIVGFDYFYRPEDLEYFLEMNKGTKPYILVTHYPFKFRQNSFDVFLKYDNILAVVSGDYHIPFCEMIDGRIPFYSVGAVAPNSIGDIHKLSFLVLYDDDGTPFFSPVPLMTRPVLRFMINTVADIEDALNKIREAKASIPDERISKPIVAAYFYSSDICSRVREFLSDECYLILQPTVAKSLEEQDEILSRPLFNPQWDLKTLIRQDYVKRMGEEYGPIADLLFEACRTSGERREKYLEQAVWKLWEIYQNEKDHEEFDKDFDLSAFDFENFGLDDEDEDENGEEEDS